MNMADIPISRIIADPISDKIALKLIGQHAVPERLMNVAYSMTAAVSDLPDGSYIAIHVGSIRGYAKIMRCFSESLTTPEWEKK